MTGPARVLLAGCVALAVPVVLYQLGGGSRWKAEQRAVQRLMDEADRRNHFIEGQQQAFGFISWVDYYYFENWRLPGSVDELRFGLPEPHEKGPTRYAFEPRDGSVTMFFHGRAGIADGEVSFQAIENEEKHTLKWECWTPDYPYIRRMLPSCVYEPR